MSRPANVLLVEDNPGDADLIIETLEEAIPSVQVRRVIDGTEALSVLLPRSRAF